MPPGIQWRAPGAEIVPDPRAGERVVFLAHFEHGFGLPVSTFFREFLDFHRLQPHHLAANFMMILSGFVTLCEGYLVCRLLLEKKKTTKNYIRARPTTRPYASLRNTAKSTSDLTEQ